MSSFIGASLSEPHLGPYSGCGLCGGGYISYVLPNAHARRLAVSSLKVSRGQGQRRGQAKSHRGNATDIVTLLNRIEHGMLYTHSPSASYRIDGYSQLRQRPAAPSAKL